MAVQKDIICPHCKKLLSSVGGFYHDEEQNMLCICCNGVIFAATESQERRSKHAIQGNHHTSTAYGGYNAGSSYSWNRKELLPIRLTQVPMATVTPGSKEVPKETTSPGGPDIEGWGAYG